MSLLHMSPTAVARRKVTPVDGTELVVHLSEEMTCVRNLEATIQDLERDLIKNDWPKMKPKEKVAFLSAMGMRKHHIQSFLLKMADLSIKNKAIAALLSGEFEEDSREAAPFPTEQGKKVRSKIRQLLDQEILGERSDEEEDTDLDDPV